VSERPIIRGPGEGRAYEIGAMLGVFKADGEETGNRVCVSEWSVEPGEAGPGAHHHDANDEVFLVTEGTMSFLVGEKWVDAPRGTCLFIPAGVTHDFANRTSEPATAFNVFVPGGFEEPFSSWMEDDSYQA
jgi:mannose-6-phosphate isomerase-like protein (cupin superfamily)